MAFWNRDEQTEQLKELWAAGHSASKIAKIMGAPTRNVIIGKVNRLGLNSRATTTRERCQRPNKRKAGTGAWSSEGLGGRVPASPRKFRLSQELQPEPPIPPSEYDVARIATADLEPEHCKWPVGDPGTAGFGHCGCKRAEGLPYCAQHAARAYNSEPVRRQQSQHRADPTDYNPHRFRLRELL